MKKQEFWNLLNEYESNSFAIHFLIEHKKSGFNLRIPIDTIVNRQEEVHKLLMNACVDEVDSEDEAEQ